jgi:hypothetical protein
MSINVTPIPRLIDLAAPAFTLGTANAAGSAVTAVASDSTLLAFDTTLPAAVAQTAVVGTAVTAPRRDHVHSGGLKGSVILSPTGVDGTGATLGYPQGRGAPAHLGDDSADQVVHWQFALPSDLNTLTRAVITIYTTSGAGNLSFALYAYAGAAVGENWNTNSAIQGNTTLTMVDEKITEINVAGLFSGVAAGDHCQLQFSRNGPLGADTIGVLDVEGLILEYT